MRISRLAKWTAGAVAGCPGIVDTSAADDSTTPTPVPPAATEGVANTAMRTAQRRGRWITAAAVILVVYGGLGVVYGPLLGGSAVWTFLGAGISTVTILGVLNIATGIGLLRLYGWARFAAALLSAGWLLFVHAPALLAAAGSGAWYAIDWLGIAGSVIVLFAVLRRWPAEPAGAA